MKGVARPTSALADYLESQNSDLLRTAFAQDRILELAWSPPLTTTYASLFESLRQQLRSPAEPFAAALRERAKARFVGDTTLTLNQRQIFFMFVVRGNSDTRREAVDMMFSLQGMPFEDSVRAVHDGGHDVWALNKPEQWSGEEIDRLITRAPGDCAWRWAITSMPLTLGRRRSMSVTSGFSDANALEASAALAATPTTRISGSLSSRAMKLKTFASTSTGSTPSASAKPGGGVTRSDGRAGKSMT